MRLTTTVRWSAAATLTALALTALGVALQAEVSEHSSLPDWAPLALYWITALFVLGAACIVIPWARTVPYRGKWIAEQQRAQELEAEAVGLRENLRTAADKVLAAEKSAKEAEEAKVSMFDLPDGTPVIHLKPDKVTVTETREPPAGSLTLSEPGKHYYRDASVAIGSFGPQLNGKTFENCEIIGPAILGVNVGRGLSMHEIWVDGDPETFQEQLFWEVPANASRVGAIGSENCRFVHCRFVGVGFMGTAKTLEMIRKAIVSLVPEPFSKRPTPGMAMPQRPPSEE